MYRISIFVIGRLFCEIRTWDKYTVDLFPVSSQSDIVRRTAAVYLRLSCQHIFRVRRYEDTRLGASVSLPIPMVCAMVFQIMRPIRHGTVCIFFNNPVASSPPSLGAVLEASVLQKVAVCGCLSRTDPYPA